MINADTKPILVRAASRPKGIIHFASNDAKIAPTMPYCRTTIRHSPSRSLEEIAAEGARYLPIREGLMSCHGCAELIEKHPSWRPNHFPLMEPDLRWI